MSIEKVMSSLRTILIDLGIPEELIDLDSYLYQDLQLDSLEIVELSLALKRQMGIKVKLETRQDKTLAEVCSLIESAISTKIEEIDVMSP
ncbi:Acyl carrier protein [Hyella patelloides LEGE 07179]|uniref:Acyl carrier protein n=1 Tax=Hyella patelloides LEGE 07179 TaxID=945734 RepID=A0A563W1I1_9CYAN|nr:phosphopantetheine-binding protein [Hyella patelloides]VEP17564.1 Acyl carrier protein [Hyella patelloides LEGE 07179]